MVLMTIKEQLTENMKTAMKAREMEVLGTIRYVMAAVKNVEIDQGELDDAGVQKVIASEVKKLKDAVLDFQKGGRADLVESENKKIAQLEAYLPTQMNDEALEKLVREQIAAVGGDNMGALMGACIKAAAGQADGGRVSALVKKILAAD